MEKKILIVDDDSFSRKILKNFLAKFSCRTYEAADGVEALAIIALESPDLVLLDVNMPVLNGLETLQEIRSSATHSRLPVVAVSAHAERSLVMKFIDLGISGFVLKPLRPAVTIRRLEQVLEAIQHDSRESPLAAAQESGAEARPRLLLVDRDPNFREFARPLLEGQFEVLESQTGALGWQAFQEQEPKIVLVEEGLQLLGAERLAKMIRQAGRSPVRLYLLSDAHGVGGEIPAPYDGVIRKSFIPEVFTRELNATLFAERSLPVTVRTLIRTRLRDELITAAQQSIGVLTSQETGILDGAEGARVSRAVRVRTALRAPDGSATVLVEWFAGERDAEQIASKIIGAPVTLADGAADAVSELVNTIAGRIRASLATSGFQFEQQAPELVVDLARAAEEPDEWELWVPFRTSEGESFLIATWVQDGPPARAAAPAPAPARGVA